ncbi:hypothetical protein [Pedobacter sandarakinus]|uniref:hypothetical protein n=1 Tax=Pedobacter sandarakinus TaxID=353156 RepID=UPI002246DB3A|nr:hypothetical protein [Pedobacter sandarakinus]MCX2576374.1 hypothetical protein [Pedobacter sandarakinus]
MKYEADYELHDLINQYKKKLTNNVLFGLSIFILMSFMIFYSTKFVLDLKYILAEIIFISAIAYFQYSQIVPNGNIINNTVIEIRFEDEKFFIKTSSFKVLFWFEKDSKEMVFNSKEFIVTHNPKAIKHLFGYDKDVVKLSDKEKYVYLLFPFFNKDIQSLIIEKS